MLRAIRYRRRLYLFVMTRTAASSRRRTRWTRSSSVSVSGCACWTCVNGIGRVLGFDVLDEFPGKRFRVIQRMLVPFAFLKIVCIQSGSRQRRFTIRTSINHHRSRRCVQASVAERPVEVLRTGVGGRETGRTPACMGKGGSTCNRLNNHVSLVPTTSLLVHLAASQCI